MFYKGFYTINTEKFYSTVPAVAHSRYLRSFAVSLVLRKPDECAVEPSSDINDRSGPVRLPNVEASEAWRMDLPVFHGLGSHGGSGDFLIQ